MNNLDRDLLIKSNKAMLKRVQASGDPLLIRIVTRNVWLSLKTLFPQEGLEVLMSMEGAEDQLRSPGFLERLYELPRPIPKDDQTQ